MEKLNFPDYEFRIRHSADNKLFIFDPLRKKEVLLTPEEWVRQHIIRFLIDDRHFPPSLISVEAGIKVNRLSRRFDIVVYNRKGNPFMLIECKSAHVPINQITFDQVAAYNLTIEAEFLLVTNGIKHFFASYDPFLKEFQFQTDIPFFENL
jgi:hypothetical protein